MLIKKHLSIRDASQILTLMLLATFCGCSGRPGRLAAPKINAAQSAKVSIEEFDSNGDSVLDENEMKACPALAYAADAYDLDKDGELTSDEIQTGIERWAASRTGAILLPFRVQLNGRPLANAEVKLIPVDFLSGAVTPAQGIADSRGTGMLGLAPEDRPSGAPNTPLVPPGIYRVEITHPTASVPAKFNTESTIGIETYIASKNPAGVVWNLTSR